MSEAPPLRWLFGTAEQKQIARRYWIHDTAMGLLNVSIHQALRLLPTDWCSGFGAAASRLSPIRYAESDARARRLWARVRPEADQATVDAAMRRLWRGIGRNMAEYSVLDRLWSEGRIEVDGAEHLHALRAIKRPILAACVHLGNWEVVPVTGIGLGYMGASLALLLDNRFEQRLADRTRQRFGGRAINATRNSPKEIIRELRERGPMVIFVDEFIRGRVFAPAFGRTIKAEGNMAYVVRLAKITGAAIIPAYCLRVGDQCRFKVNILPPMDLIDTGEADADLLTNVTRLNAIFEPIVKANLDQWFYALDIEIDE